MLNFEITNIFLSKHSLLDVSKTQNVSLTCISQHLAIISLSSGVITQQSKKCCNKQVFHVIDIWIYWSLHTYFEQQHNKKHDTVSHHFFCTCSGANSNEFCIWTPSTPLINMSNLIYNYICDTVSKHPFFHHTINIYDLRMTPHVQICKKKPTKLTNFFRL